MTSDLDALVATRALMRLPRPERSLDPMYRWVASAVFALGDPTAVLDAVRAGLLSTSASLFDDDEALQARDDAMADVARWQASNLSLLYLGEPDYPAQLLEIADPPPLLFVEGPTEVLSRLGVAVVGTRNPSAEGIDRANRAVRVLVDAGLTVISGLAKGIDSVAHQATIDRGGITVAVMGTPIAKRYPAQNATLARDILSSGGALLSEFVPDTATHPWHFLRRNRTMSGLALATLVIEASESSGARSQAISALDQGRPVFIPESVVESHEWARHLVEDGRKGVRAISIARPREIADALAGDADTAKSAAF